MGIRRAGAGPGMWFGRGGWPFPDCLTEGKQDGFPLKTGGNDRGGAGNEGEERVGMMRGGE